MVPRTRKLKAHEILKEEIVEPDLSPSQWERCGIAVGLFNAGKFWSAHEAWEGVWLERTEPSRLFFQGIIQAAAGFHLACERPRIPGAIRNFEKSLVILALFPRKFLGMDMDDIRRSVRQAKEFLEGNPGVGKLPLDRVPQLQLVREGQ